MTVKDLVERCGIGLAGDGKLEIRNVTRGSDKKMARKTIYVRDEDLQVFEQAEDLGGDSLSAVIAKALKRFVAAKQAEAQGMEEFTLEVGRIVPAGRGDDDVRKVRFVGRLLAEGEVTSPENDCGTDYEIYQTQAGKILVWWKTWSRWENESTLKDYAALSTLPGFDEPVEGILDLIHPRPLPGSLLQDAAEALGQELVEFID